MTRAEAVAHLRFHVASWLADGADATRIAQLTGVIDDLNWDADATVFTDETQYDLAEMVEAIRPFLPVNVQNRVKNRDFDDLQDWIYDG